MLFPKVENIYLCNKNNHYTTHTVSRSAIYFEQRSAPQPYNYNFETTNIFLFKKHCLQCYTFPFKFSFIHNMFNILSTIQDKRNIFKIKKWQRNVHPRNFKLKKLEINCDILQPFLVHHFAQLFVARVKTSAWKVVWNCRNHFQWMILCELHSSNSLTSEMINYRKSHTHTRTDATFIYGITIVRRMNVYCISTFQR